MAWVTAPSILQLIAEIKAKWPGSGPFGTYRDVQTAINLGNADSDHVPWLNNTVRALDIGTSKTVPVMTAAGDTMFGLAEFLRQKGAAGDPRMVGGGYVIWNRRIATASGGWAWRVYNGSNPHTDHIHLSVSENPAGYNSPASWGLASAVPPEQPDPNDGVVSNEGENPYIAAGPGFTETVITGDWLARSNWRQRGAQLVWSADSWVGQRLVPAQLGAAAGDPYVRDSGQPRRTEIGVAEYDYLGESSSGYLVTYAIEANHTFYDAHWNIGIWAASPGVARLPRAGFRVDSQWMLLEQLQVLDGVAALSGQLFVPTGDFTLALLSDWAAYGDLPPDILDGETRVRFANMTVLSIEAYPFGIGGPLSVGADLVFSDFEGQGVPGTMDITRPSNFSGGGCV